MAITISGENNNDRILAQDGVIDQISGINIVGLITASHINVGSNIQLGNAGIITATTFVGNLTGNVNSTSPLLLQTGGSERFRITGNNELGIAGANYGSSGQVLTSGGSGSAVTWSAIPTQVTISNNADNRIITGGSGTNLNGEQYFTWNGNNLALRGGEAQNCTIELASDEGDDNADFWRIMAQASDNALAIDHYGSGSWVEKLRIDSSGRLLLGTTTEGESTADDLTIATSGSTGITLRSGTSNAGNILFSDGTSGDDEQRGILQYHHSDNSMRLFTNAAERLRINSSGFIGMGGNTNPTNVLHIKTAVTNTAVATIESTATNSYPLLRLKNDAREYQLTCHGGLSDSFTIYDGTSAAHRFLIDSNGKVSIASGAYGGGGTVPELYVKGTSGRQMKIHNSNAATSSASFSMVLPSFLEAFLYLHHQYLFCLVPTYLQCPNL